MRDIASKRGLFYDYAVLSAMPLHQEYAMKMNLPRGVAVTTAAILLSLAAACGNSSETTSESPSPSTVVTTEVPVSPSPSPSEEPPDPTVTHVIQGKEYTCAQIVGAPDEARCGKLTQGAFNEYGANIDAFVNSGALGPWNNYDNETLYYEDVAFAGLVACGLLSVPEATSAMYVTVMQAAPMVVGDDATYADMFDEGVEYLPVWFGAGKTLCPGAEASKLTSEDFVAP